MIPSTLIITVIYILIATSLTVDVWKLDHNICVNSIVRPVAIYLTGHKGGTGRSGKRPCGCILSGCLCYFGSATSIQQWNWSSLFGTCYAPRSGQWLQDRSRNDSRTESDTWHDLTRRTAFMKVAVEIEYVLLSYVQTLEITIPYTCEWRFFHCLRSILYLNCLLEMTNH